MTTAAQLWDRLREDGVVEGEAPEPAEPSSPWFVRAMLGIAGWIGALFLLGFVAVALSFVMNSAAAAMLVGAACCAGAYALFRTFHGQDFVEQFALALSLAGQGLLIVGLGQLLDGSGPSFLLAVAAMQAVLACLVSNFLHRLLASAGAAVAFALAIGELQLHGLAAPLLCAGLAWIWLEPRRWAASAQLWRPLGYGLLLALLLVESFRLLGMEAMFGGNDKISWMARHGPLLGRVLTTAVLVWVAAKLTMREGFPPGSRTFTTAVGASVLIGLLCLGAPGLASALLILLLGFAAGARLLVALGVLSLLGLIAHFYYSLHATLLEKSGLLAITGLFLLAAAALLRREAPTIEEAPLA